MHLLCTSVCKARCPELRIWRAGRQAQLAAGQGSAHPQTGRKRCEESQEYAVRRETEELPRMGFQTSRVLRRGRRRTVDRSEMRSGSMADRIRSSLDTSCEERLSPEGFLAILFFWVFVVLFCFMRTQLGDLLGPCPDRRREEQILNRKGSSWNM